MSKKHYKIQIVKGINGTNQFTSNLNASQMTFKSKDTSIAVSVELSLKIPKKIISKGVDAVADYLQNLFQPMRDKCDIDIYVGEDGST